MRRQVVSTTYNNSKYKKSVIVLLALFWSKISWKTRSSIRLGHFRSFGKIMRFWKQLQERENFYLLLIERNFVIYLQHYGRNDVICNYLSMKEEKRLNLSSLITWLKRRTQIDINSDRGDLNLLLIVFAGNKNWTVATCLQSKGYICNN